jgi:hypothetical protein
MTETLNRMRKAATAFAALVVLGVLLFVEEEEGAQEVVSQDAPVVRAQAPERGPRPERQAMDGVSEFASDEDLIDDTEGFSTDGFDTQGIDTEGFETEGHEPGGLDSEPQMETDPAFDTAYEYALVVDESLTGD